MRPGLRRLSLACLLAGVAFALPAPAPAAACAHADVMPAADNLRTIRAATLCLLNAERGERGLRRLHAQRQLRRAAQRYSAQMVRQRFFDHVCPTTGSTLASRVRRTSYLDGGVRSWVLGENLAWGAGARATPRAIVRAWMRSPGHRRNILDHRFRHIGIGVMNGAPRAVGDAPAATYTTDFGVRARGG